jgi:uncharacterized membrane protein YesL
VVSRAESRRDAVAGEAAGPATGERAAPSIGGAIRAAAEDGYYHSWRLVPANVVWSVVALSIAVLGLIAPPAIILFPLLALPTAGIFRVTTRIVRGEAVSFWDAIDAWRTNALTTIGIGAGFVATTIVLGFNVVSGLASASPLGWGLATLAGWGLLAAWLLAWTAWPILVDPWRADRPIIARLRLAALLVLAHPIRIGLLGIVLGLFLAVSTLAVVALATVSVAFSALVASRFILPAADRLEARLASDEAVIGPTAGAP